MCVRVCGYAGVYGGVGVGVRVCACVGGCARLCMGVCGCAGVCVGVGVGVYVCVGVGVRDSYSFLWIFCLNWPHLVHLLHTDGRDSLLCNYYAIMKTEYDAPIAYAV